MLVDGDSKSNNRCDNRYDNESEKSEGTKKINQTHL